VIVLLSKIEQDYLSRNLKVTKSYERVLKHRIRKKLKQLFEKELPLLEERDITEFYNGITEFYNKNERARRDSNPRPNAPQAFPLI